MIQAPGPLPFATDRDDVVALRALLELVTAGRHALYPTAAQLRRASKVIDHIDRLTPK